MGFRVTWQLIYIGLHDQERINKQIFHDDLFDFLKIIIDENTDNQDEIVNLLSNEGDEETVDKLLRKFVDYEISSKELDIRKWRTLMLVDLLEEIHEKYLTTDPFYSVTLLYDFWLSYFNPNESTDIYPQDSIAFLETDVKDIISENEKWLIKEIKDIILNDGIIQ